MTDSQKSQAVIDGLLMLEGEYRRAFRDLTAVRVRDVRLELEASPDIAVRLFDIIQSI